MSGDWAFDDSAGLLDKYTLPWPRGQSIPRAAQAVSQKVPAGLSRSEQLKNASSFWPPLLGSLALVLTLAPWGHVHSQVNYWQQGSLRLSFGENQAKTEDVK